MADRTWTITRDQLIDAIANISVRGTRLPGRDDPIVIADDMADAILSQLPADEPALAGAEWRKAARAQQAAQAKTARNRRGKKPQPPITGIRRAT